MGPGNFFTNIPGFYPKRGTNCKKRDRETHRNRALNIKHHISALPKVSTTPKSKKNNTNMKNKFLTFEVKSTNTRTRLSIRT